MMVRLWRTLLGTSEAVNLPIHPSLFQGRERDGEEGSPVEKGVAELGEGPELLLRVHNEGVPGDLSRVAGQGWLRVKGRERRGE